VIGFKFRWNFHPKRVRNAAERASYRNLGHAGASIRLTARRSIRRSKNPSKEGKPPHTRKGQLKRSLRYAVDRQRERVLIGPTFTVVGRSAMAHEFGGKYKKQRYPARPFMGPALEKSKNRISKLWANSIK
jgi:phage gpG-like protein